MQYYPGGINYRTQAGLLQLMQLTGNRLHDFIHRGTRITGGDSQALTLQTLPYYVYQQLTGISFPKLLNPPLGDKSIHTGQSTKLAGHQDSILTYPGSSSKVPAESVATSLNKGDDFAFRTLRMLK